MSTTKKLTAQLVSALAVLLAMALAGCSGSDFVSGERCSAERRCSAGQAEVCGEDGQQYACAALARCEGVIVDSSGAACEPPITCPPSSPPECLMGERLSCEVGFEGGCMMCECEPDECPEIETPICQAGERLFCTGLEPLDGSCPQGCFCGPTGCPPIAQPECELWQELACEEGPDGCPDCYCTPMVCPAVEPPVCGPGEATVCDEDDFCGTSCWCAPVACPEDLDLACPPEYVTTCLPGDLCGETCWCEPAVCGELVVPECEPGQRHERVYGRPPCSFLACVDVACEAIACNLFCPNGYLLDKDGCETCQCRPGECFTDDNCDSDWERCAFASDVTCDGPVESCGGVCEPAVECEPGAPLCGPGEACLPFDRAWCCSGPEDPACGSKPPCPFTCQ